MKKSNITVDKQVAPLAIILIVLFLIVDIYGTMSVLIKTSNYVETTGIVINTYKRHIIMKTQFICLLYNSTIQRQNGNEYTNNIRCFIKHPIKEIM